MADDELYDDIIASIQSDLDSISIQTQDGIETAVLSGVAQAIIDTGVPTTNLMSRVKDVARDYAREKSADLSDLIDETTKDKIKQVIADAIDSDMTPEEIVEAIQETGVFSDYRATMIANTEIANAQIYGNYVGWREAGIKKIQWVVDGDPCEICQMNDGEIREFGEPFPSGDLMPTVHPNCECGLAAVLVQADMGTEVPGS